MIPASVSMRNSGSCFPKRRVPTRPAFRQRKWGAGGNPDAPPIGDHIVLSVDQVANGSVGPTALELYRDQALRQRLYCESSALPWRPLTIHPSSRVYSDRMRRGILKAGEANGQPLSDGEFCAILGSAAVDVCEPSCAVG